MNASTCIRGFAFGLAMAALLPVSALAAERVVVVDEYPVTDVTVIEGANRTTVIRDNAVVEDIYVIVPESRDDQRIRLDPLTGYYPTRWEKFNADINTDGFSTEGIPTLDGVSEPAL